MASNYWRDKVVLVTGGSSGLGRTIAEQFAQRGARVVLVGLEPQRVAAAEAQFRQAGHQVLGLAADVTQQPEVDRLFEKAVGWFGQLDVLVNNAGRSMRGRILDITPEQF
ncbi:MAG TPA: SDR family NAD(P)-dependent oxidoreductase, partial [Thermoguttaceae bacterium]|nr:SDR family NAD(P)-dependent oxidoreductase [Thermoguttaceae bacterium]